MATQPFKEQRGPNVVREVGDDMCAFAYCRHLVHLQCVGFDHVQLAGERVLQLGQCRNAASVAFDRDHRRPRLKQRAREASRPGPNLVNALALQRSGDGRDPRKKLAVQDEILAKCLAGTKPVAGDGVAKGFGWRTQASARWAAASAAIRIAAAIGRGSARSWPAMSKAVP